MAKGISSLYQLHNITLNATIAYGAPPAYGQNNSFQLWSETTRKPSDIMGQPDQITTTWKGQYCFDDSRYNIPKLPIAVNDSWVPAIRNRHINVDILEHTPEFIAFIQKNTDPKVLKQAIRAHEKLVEHRFPKHYKMMSKDRKKAEMAELRIFRMALAAYLSSKNIDDQLSDDDKEQYQALLLKSEQLLQHLQKDPARPVLKETKKTPESSPGFFQFTQNRLKDWAGYSYLEGLSDVSGKEQLRRILLFIRHQLSNIRGDELSWAYKNNTLWMKVAEEVINANGQNDSAYNLIDAQAKLLQTRDARRHLKHHPGMGIFIIDAILAGVKMYDKRVDGAETGEKPSLYECYQQLPASTQTALKTGLLNQMMGNTRFWTKFSLDQQGLTMEDIAIGNMNLLEVMNLGCIFGMMVQFGFLLQSYAALAEKRNDAEAHIRQLKLERNAAIALKDKSEVIRLDNTLKQAEKDLRALNNKLTAQRAEIFMQFTEIGLILLCMSFGPAAAWIPVAMAVIDAVMKMVDLVIEHGMTLSEKYEERDILKKDYAALHLELENADEKEKSFLILSMLHKRHEIRETENEITQAWFIFSRSVAVELMMDAVRFVAMGMLPLGAGLGVMAFAQVNKWIMELVTDFINMPEPAEEKMPYTLRALTDDCFQTTAEGEITDQLNLAKLSQENVLYVKQNADGTIQYGVKGDNQLHTFDPAKLDIELDDNLSESELVAALEDHLPDILALTDARGHTNALEQLEKRDKNEALPASKKQESPIEAPFPRPGLPA